MEMSSLLYSVESKIKELEEYVNVTLKKLEPLDIENCSEEDISEAVADALVGEIDYDKLEDEFLDAEDMLLSLKDIKSLS